MLGLLAYLEARRAGPRTRPRRRGVYLAGVFLGADLILPFVAWVLWGERPSRGVLAAVPVAALGVVALILIAQPACTVVFAAIILGQIPSAGQLLGVLLVLARLSAALTVRPAPAGRAAALSPRSRRFSRRGRSYRRSRTL